MSPETIAELQQREVSKLSFVDKLYALSIGLYPVLSITDALSTVHLRELYRGNAIEANPILSPVLQNEGEVSFIAVKVALGFGIPIAYHHLAKRLRQNHDGNFFRWAICSWMLFANSALGLATVNNILELSLKIPIPGFNYG